MRKPVRKPNKKPLPFLLAGTLSFIILFLLIILVPPTTTVSFFGMSLSIFVFFFPLLTTLLYSLPRYFLVSKKHALLLATFGSLYATMLLLELRHPFFLIILLALFFTLELLFTSMRQ